jgi:hypothetical protein
MRSRSASAAGACELERLGRRGGRRASWRTVGASLGIRKDGTAGLAAASGGSATVGAGAGTEDVARFATGGGGGGGGGAGDGGGGSGAATAAAGSAGAGASALAGDLFEATSEGRPSRPVGSST